MDRRVTKEIELRRTSFNRRRRTTTTRSNPWSSTSTTTRTRSDPPGELLVVNEDDEEALPELSPQQQERRDAEQRMVLPGAYAMDVPAPSAALQRGHQNTIRPGAYAMEPVNNNNRASSNNASGSSSNDDNNDANHQQQQRGGGEEESSPPFHVLEAEPVDEAAERERSYLVERLQNLERQRTTEREQMEELHIQMQELRNQSSLITNIVVGRSTSNLSRVDSTLSASVISFQPTPPSPPGAAARPAADSPSPATTNRPIVPSILLPPFPGSEDDVVEEGGDARRGDPGDGNNEEESESTTAFCTPWRKRRIAVAVATLLMVVGAVSVVLGALLSSNRKGHDDDDSSPAPTPAPFVPTSTEIWEQLGDDILGKNSFDYFGSAVALSADGMIVASGAPYRTEFGKQVGQVQVFRYNVAEKDWNQMGQNLNGEEAGDLFGTRVALSGNGEIIAVGAPSKTRRSFVHVFQYSEAVNLWYWFGNPTNTRGNIEGEYGKYLALSYDGRTLIVGDDRNDDAGRDSGHVTVYTYDEDLDKWDILGERLVGQAGGDRFGHGVAISGDGRRIAVVSSGVVRSFEFEPSSSRWKQLGQALMGTTSGEQIGLSVALSSDGTVLAMGDAYSDGNGSVRLFQLDETTGTWNPFGQRLTGEAEGDLFGQAVALSADGIVVAVGAGRNNRKGQNAGLVLVYGYSDGNWISLGQFLQGMRAFDSFGSSVALSQTGRIVAAGAYLHDGNGLDSGKVRVYQGQTS